MNFKEDDRLSLIAQENADRVAWLAEHRSLSKVLARLLIAYASEDFVRLSNGKSSYKRLLCKKSDHPFGLSLIISKDYKNTIRHTYRTG